MLWAKPACAGGFQRTFLPRGTSRRMHTGFYCRSDSSPEMLVVISKQSALTSFPSNLYFLATRQSLFRSKFMALASNGCCLACLRFLCCMSYNCCSNPTTLACFSFGTSVARQLPAKWSQTIFMGHTPSYLHMILRTIRYAPCQVA